jgi:hypothetical protein
VEGSFLIDLLIIGYQLQAKFYRKSLLSDNVVISKLFENDYVYYSKKKTKTNAHGAKKCWMLSTGNLCQQKY